MASAPVPLGSVTSICIPAIVRSIAVLIAMPIGRNDFGFDAGIHGGVQ
jgi:hypothetical protein